MSRSTWLTRGTVAIAVAMAGMLVGFGCSSSGSLPDDLPTVDLDDGAVGGPIYYVEVRARPNYLLHRIDPASGTTAPLFEVPERGAISSVAASPTGDRLALAYTDEFGVPGNGLYLLDVTAGGDGGGEVVGESALTLLAPELDAEFYDDLAYSPDGSTVWASVGKNDESRLIAVDVDSGRPGTVIENAVAPAPGPGWLAYLPVEADGSRVSVAVLDEDSGETTVYSVLDGTYDLGHLLADVGRGRLWFTALIPNGQPMISFGEPAGAHGAHDGPSQWLSLDLETGQVSGLAETEPSNVRDSALWADGLLLESNPDGLILPFGGQEPVLTSRVITEIASTPGVLEP
ncbi:MAG: hypothetical protein AAF962_15700 [Actinomycetota bacterium]